MQKIRTKLEVYGSKCLPKKSRKTQINTLHLQLKELEKSNIVINDKVMAKYLKVPIEDIEVIKRCISVPVELDDLNNDVKYEE